MHPTNTALLEDTGRHLEQGTVTIQSDNIVQSIQSAVQPKSNAARHRDPGYHFILADGQTGCPAWYVVNGRGVPDDTLTNFTRQLASSLGLEQAQAQFAPLLSYLTWQEQRGILWYDPASCLQDAWQNYLRQSTSYRKRVGAVVMVLAAIGKQDRILHTLRSMLGQFYTFAIASQTYGYHHPFSGQRVYEFVVRRGGSGG